MIVIGVGDNLQNAEDDMKKIAGSKGTVYLFDSYLDLTRHFSDMYDAFLGELMSRFLSLFKGQKKGFLHNDCYYKVYFPVITGKGDSFEQNSLSFTIFLTFLEHIPEKVIPLGPENIFSHLTVVSLEIGH